MPSSLSHSLLWGWKACSLHQSLSPPLSAVIILHPGFKHSLHSKRSPAYWNMEALGYTHTRTWISIKSGLAKFHERLCIGVELYKIVLFHKGTLLSDDVLLVHDKLYLSSCFWICLFIYMHQDGIFFLCCYVCHALHSILRICKAI